MTTPRFFVLLLTLLLGMLYASAQKTDVSGRVVDSDEGSPLDKATIQLYRISSIRNSKKDTTFIVGTLSNENGEFVFSSVKSGNYLLKVTFMGYETLTRNITKQGSKAISLGNLMMESNSVALDETIITAKLQKMVIKDDTVVYNADAFSVPEGSVIEALVEVLPGAKIDDDGKISINGKNVKKFKLDGRDFMTGNNDAVMKNLPSYVIDKVKAYDEKSDLSRLTGIDDGNDDFVLEFVTKRSARRGLQANPDVGYGTDHRYGIRLTAMKPFGDMRYTFMGNANNVNDRNFSGRGGRGRGNNNGQRHSKTTALDISYENGKNVKLSGRVTWNHNDADNWNRSASESFVNTRSGAFSNSVNQSYSRNNGWTGNMNLQWTIDSLTTLSFRPNVNFSSNDSRGFSSSASFNANPYDYVSNPLNDEGCQRMSDLGMIVNSRENKSLGYGDSKDLSSQMQIYRRLNKNGRNIALSSNFSLRNGNNQNANLSGVHLYQRKNRFGNDSTYQTNRYTTSASKSRGFSVGITYTEPLWVASPPSVDSTRMQSLQQRGGRGGGGRQREGRGGFGAQGLFLQLNYRYSYNHQKNDPLTYDFPEISDDSFREALNDYREWVRLFGFLPSPYEDYLSTRLTRYSERTENGHNADIQLRLVTEKYNVNLGVNMQPQRSHFIQQYLGKPVDTVRNVMNISPTLNMRYRYDRQTNLQVQFRGTMQQPSITQQLDIYDDTNPLSITMGNPGLKPSFTTNLSVNFQKQRKPTYIEDSLGLQIPKAQRHWSYTTNGSFQRTTNSIGNIVTYNESTGGRISRPDNFNGNWSANAGASFNIALDTLSRWDVSGSVNGSYRHQVNFVNLNRTAEPDRNITHTYNVTPSASLGYRNKVVNFSINGRATYARTENRLQASRNLSTWNFSYGGNTRINFPWGTSLSTDIHMYSKRGYADASLNTNELLWNAQLSHSFLKGKLLTVMLQWYDILSEQSNFSRTVNANGWRDQEVNAITSYVMLHISYRLNFFGGRNSGGGRFSGREGGMGRGGASGRGGGGRGDWRRQRGDF